MTDNYSAPLLTAAMIVRDEAAQITDCLQSLADVVDAVEVVDTGSEDGTAALVAQAGAAVSHARWSDDFSAARNAALSRCTTPWILSIDADERLVADAVALRAFLQEVDADVVVVDIDNLHNELPYTHPAIRLFSRERARWVGRVHEQLTSIDDNALRVAKVDRDVLHIRHVGYESADVRAAKSARNAALAESALEQLRLDADANADEIASTLLDLGRSYVGSDRKPNAAAIFDELREQFPGTREWMVATDFLARLHLAGGNDTVAIELSEQLRAAGGPQRFCNWLAAQGHVQLGNFHLAQRLLADVDEVVDTSGRRYNSATLRELKEIVGRLVEIAGADALD